jgi:hypothetical protein
MRSIWLAALVACWGTPPPAAPGQSAPSKLAPACVRPPDETAAISHASGNMRRVQYCLGTLVDQCFSLDLVSGQLEHLTAPPPAPASPADTARVETTNPELKVCTSGTCKALTPQVWPGAAPLHAATNGAYAVVLLGEAESGKGYADVWDVVKAKKVTTIRYPHGDYRCGDVAMLGDIIYIGASMCKSPSARAALYTVNGRKIANVGPKDFGTFGSAFVQVEGTTWAFLEENGTRIAVQDVAKGKVLRTFDVGQLWSGQPPGPKNDVIGNPGESAIVALAPAKLAVIAGTPANGSVAVLDVNSGDIQVVRAPLCR